MADGGYDVSDHRDVDPRYGTLADAEDLLAEAHRLGLRVVVDLVVNHTSAAHAWFRDALAAAPGSPERARYFFRDGRGTDGAEPPNNWISAFGGPAWTRVHEADGTPGQWYLHTFAPEQPDLDWECPQVLADVDDVLRFWLDRGVDGFRVDAAPAMAKRAGLPDAAYDGSGRFASAEWVDNPHWDDDGVHAIFRRWRQVLDGYPGDRVFVAEAVVSSPERLARYLRPDELHTAFNFAFMYAAWEPAALRSVVDATRDALAGTGAPPTWALSSHDETRHVTRYGRAEPDATPGWSPDHGRGAAPATDLALGTRRARAAALLMLALPGGAYLYQGEELGLPEVEDLPDAVREDPVFARSGGAVPGRDGCRVPLPWSGARAPYGFGPDGSEPWLPQPAAWADLTVEAQLTDPGSVLALYRSALGLRRALLADLPDAAFAWAPAEAGVLAFDRGDRLRCVVNLGDRPVPLEGTPVLASAPLVEGALPVDAAAWLRT